MDFSQPWLDRKRERHAPLLEAEERLRRGQRSRGSRPDKDRHSPECPLSKVQEIDEKKPKYDSKHEVKERYGREEQQARRNGQPAARNERPVPRDERPAPSVANEHAVHHQPEDGAPKATIPPKCRRPLFVDRLTLPGAADEKPDRISRSADKKAKKMVVEKKPEAKEMIQGPKRIQKGSDLQKNKSAPRKQTNLERQSLDTRNPSKDSAAGQKRKRTYKSPLKKLYEKDRTLRAQAVGIFETEYQKHYKDWVGEMWGNKKHKQRSGEWGRVGQ